MDIKSRYIRVGEDSKNIQKDQKEISSILNKAYVHEIKDCVLGKSMHIEDILKIGRVWMVKRGIFMLINIDRLLNKELNNSVGNEYNLQGYNNYYRTLIEIYFGLGALVHKIVSIKEGKAVDIPAILGSIQNDRFFVISGSLDDINKKRIIGPTQLRDGYYITVKVIYTYITIILSIKETVLVSANE
ncbi:MAG: hypothetical protein MHMPM18_000813 [Marteilia pararefringens]